MCVRVCFVVDGNAFWIDESFSLSMSVKGEIACVCVPKEENLSTEMDPRLKAGLQGHLMEQMNALKRQTRTHTLTNTHKHTPILTPTRTHTHTHTPVS